MVMEMVKAMAQDHHSMSIANWLCKLGACSVLCTTAAQLTVHPIHVLCKPIASHKCHSPVQHLPHGIQLLVAGAHCFHHLSTLLRHGRCESEVVPIHIEFLRESEGLLAVDGVLRSRTKFVPMGFFLRLTPLVASPVRMAPIVVGACMVGYLLHIHVPLVHVEL